MLGQTPYSLGWTYDMDMMKDLVRGCEFDVVWMTSFYVCDLLQPLSSGLDTKTFYVAGIHDCTTAVLRSMGARVFMPHLDFKTRLFYLLHWMRSWRFQFIEANLFEKYNLILVQTDVDRMWFTRISRGRLNERTMVLPNGVNETLFDLPIESTGKDVLYFGGGGAQYGKVLLWLIRRVWPLIKSQSNDTRFFIICGNALPELKSHMALDDKIVHIEYVPDISDVLRNKAVTLAPVFKNCGTINKVIESMAAGVPVVGDSGSFSGIREFVNGRHGIVGSDAASVARGALSLLNSPKQRSNMAHCARELVRKHFMWNERIVRINNRLKQLISSQVTASKAMAPPKQIEQRQDRPD
jgi:glycosyltransferase involved in cell wall biosynthesis